MTQDTDLRTEDYTFVFGGDIAVSCRAESVHDGPLTKDVPMAKVLFYGTASYDDGLRRLGISLEDASSAVQKHIAGMTSTGIGMALQHHILLDSQLLFIIPVKSIPGDGYPVRGYLFDPSSRAVKEVDGPPIKMTPEELSGLKTYWSEPKFVR